MEQKQQSIQQSSDKRRARGNETRKLILETAISTIASQGLGNLTLDRVADKAGVSRGLVVFHFQSKRQLIKESLELLGNTFSEGWDALIENDEGTTMDKLLRLIDYDHGFAFKNPEYVSAWTSFWGESNGNELYRELAVPRDIQYAHEMEELIAKLMDEEGQDKGELTAINNALNAMLFGFWVTSHLNPTPDGYKNGKIALNLFISKIFPNQTISAN